MPLYLTLAGIYFGASMIQGLTGFGFAVISVPIVASLTSPTTAIAYNVAIATVVSAQKAYMLREHLNIRWTLLFYAAVLPFVPLGVIFISRLSRDAAIASMGIYVVVAAVLQLVSRRGAIARAMQTRAAFGISAGLTGLLSGAFSAPGPAAVPFFLSRHENPLAGQANLSLFFSMLVVPILGLHILIGGLKPVEILTGLPYIPIATLATFVSTRWTRRIDSKMLRTIVAGAMALMGLYLTLSPVLPF